MNQKNVICGKTSSRCTLNVFKNVFTLMILSVCFFSLDLLMALFIYVATQNGGCVNSVFTQFDMPNSFYQIMS